MNAPHGGPRRVVGVIQARMGSSRLPGKALAALAGKPVIGHVIARLRRAQRLDQVVLATTTSPADDLLAAYAAGQGVTVVRGSETNVLARFIQAAELTRADVVVRVTGDCPLVDPWLVDYLVDALPEGAGYVRVDPDGVLIDEGIDPCATWALHRLAALAGDDPVAQEHVTSYFKVHPEFVPVARCEAPPERRFSGARISVDTPADLRFLELVHARMGAAPGALDVTELVALLRREPALTAVNAHVARKHTSVGERRVVIRCDGDGRIGLGHAVRCLAIAEALRDRHGGRVLFAVETGAPAREMIAAHGFRLAGPRRDDEADEAAWLDRVLREADAEALVVDVRSALPAAALSGWRAAGIAVATVDDGSARRLAADLAFFPPVPQLRAENRTGCAGALITGSSICRCAAPSPARCGRARPATAARRTCW
ncbi:MAG: NTP transferase domain-containing protein [Alphaproteobacteria bacterium]